MLIRSLFCGAMAVARLLELAYSRHNLRHSTEMNEGEASRSTFPFIVAVHTCVMMGTLILGSGPRWTWLALLLAVQPLRAWVLLTLRNRWNARGAVASDLTIVTDGPYRFIRHPNYSVVAVELLSLPLGFGVPKLALAASVCNAALLAIRVRDEERLLLQLPGYEAHFGDKPRYLPKII